MFSQHYSWHNNIYVDHMQNHDILKIVWDSPMENYSKSATSIQTEGHVPFEILEPTFKKTNKQKNYFIENELCMIVVFHYSGSNHKSKFGSSSWFTPKWKVIVFFLKTVFVLLFTYSILSCPGHQSGFFMWPRKGAWCPCSSSLSAKWAPWLQTMLLMLFQKFHIILELESDDDRFSSEVLYFNSSRSS